MKAFYSFYFSQQNAGHNPHDADHHALYNYLDHYFEHVLDGDKDGCCTIEEEIAQFNIQDPTRKTVLHLRLFPILMILLIKIMY